MGHNLQREKMMKRLRDNINCLLENEELSGDVEWWRETDAQDCLLQLAESKESFACTSDSLGITQEGDSKRLIFAVFRQSESLFQKSIQPFQALVEEQARQLAGDGELRRVQLVLFAKDMRDRILLEETFSWKVCREIASKAQQAAGNKLPPRKKLQMFLTCTLIQKYEKQPISLGELTPYEMVHEPAVASAINLESEEEPRPEAAKIQAVIFTAKLYQMVTLYNQVGDQLFQNNVRFGMEESMGVDQAICQTLEEEPEHFYYKNNGITILAADTNSIWACTDKLILGEIGPDTDPTFSVVNGAQTITTAARYFFRLEHKKDDSEKTEEERTGLNQQFDNAKDNARVLVRVIQIPAGPEGERLAKEISVALNRQKPIHIEDIAFTTPDVHKLSEYLRSAQADGTASFRLTRRGEEIKDCLNMSLIEFARARIACAGSPGDARAKGANQLLRTRPDGDELYSFFRKDIFAADWADAEGEQETAVFKRDYGAVLFAYQVAREYEQRRRAVKVGESDYLNVIGNGKWYFTAMLTQLLNGFHVQGKDKLPDFSKFSHTFEDVREQIPQAMDLFARLTVLCAQGKELNSNLLKSNQLYEDMIQDIKSGFPAKDNNPRTEEYCLAEQFAQLFQVTLPERPVEQKTITSEDADFLILNGQTIPVCDDVQALTEITKYVLNHYPLEGKMLETHCGSWITSDPVEAQSGTGSYRKAPTHIQINGEDYWIGSSYRIGSKCRDLQVLCLRADVPRGKIKWHRKGKPGYVFEW